MRPPDQKHTIAPLVPAKNDDMSSAAFIKQWKESDEKHGLGLKYSLTLRSIHWIEKLQRLQDLETMKDDLEVGLKWVPIGPNRPRVGRELMNQQLRDALASKIEFTAEEWAKFCISSLKKYDYIKSGDEYYRPDDICLYTNSYVQQAILSYARNRMYNGVGGEGDEDFTISDVMASTVQLKGLLEQLQPSSAAKSLLPPAAALPPPERDTLQLTKSPDSGLDDRRQKVEEMKIALAEKEMYLKRVRLASQTRALQSTIAAAGTWPEIPRVN